MSTPACVPPKHHQTLTLKVSKFLRCQKFMRFLSNSNSNLFYQVLNGLNLRLKFFHKIDIDQQIDRSLVYVDQKAVTRASNKGPHKSSKSPNLLIESAHYRFHI